MTDAHASQYFLGPGSPQAVASGMLADQGQPSCLNECMPSSSDGDGDTDDIGSYGPTPARGM